MPFAATWIGLEVIILCKVRQQKTNIIYHLWNLKKNDTNEPVYKTLKKKNRHRKQTMIIKWESG